MRLVRHQKGFTLIEALIAFIVLTVGLLGAAMFQADLVKSTTETKERFEALAIIESQHEKIRADISKSLVTTDALSVISAAISSPVQGYEIELVSVSTASVDGTYRYELKVSWGDEQSISRTAYIAQVNDSVANENGVDLDPTAAAYDGGIPLPTGTLTVLDREVLDVSTGTLVSSNDSYKVYSVPSGSSSETIVGVEVDGQFVQLAKLNDSNNEIFTITGVIVNDPTNPVSYQFGCTFAGASTGENTLCRSAIPAEDVIDVAATGGAGCLIYDYKNFDGSTPGGYGKYLCVTGTGWNGQIAPRILDISNSGNADTQLAIDGEICSPKLRGYKYVILEVADAASFESSVASASDSTARRALLDEAIIAGQSGLVRFAQTSASLGHESVLWSDYFWHNPDYISSSAVSAYDPIVNHLPGDLAHQNFILFTTKTGNVTRTCDVYGLTVPSDTEVSAAVGSYFDYQSLGYPGRDYTPNGFDAQFFNDWDSDTEIGSLILGYTLAKHSIAGNLVVTGGVGISGLDFNVSGNPEPIVSIECPINTTPVASGASEIYSYSCGVPTGWTGDISVTTSAAISACSADLSGADGAPLITANGFQASYTRVTGSFDSENYYFSSSCN